MFDRFTKKLREIIFEITRLDCPPEKMARALALGMLVGLSPYIGFHTYITVALSVWLRLPLVVMLIATHMTNPLTIPVYFTFATKFGIWILGTGISLDINWSELTFRNFLNIGEQLLLPFFTGTSVLSVMGAVLTYIVSLPLFKLYRKKRKEKGL